MQRASGIRIGAMHVLDPDPYQNPLLGCVFFFFWSNLSVDVKCRDLFAF